MINNLPIVFHYILPIHILQLTNILCQSIVFTNLLIWFENMTKIIFY